MNKLENCIVMRETQCNHPITVGFYAQFIIHLFTHAFIYLFTHLANIFFLGFCCVIVQTTNTLQQTLEEITFGFWIIILDVYT